MPTMFKETNIPVEDSSIYNSPNTDLVVNLSNKGAELVFNTSEQFDITIYKVADNTKYELFNVSNKNGENKFLDEKVFSYEKVSYQLEIINNYTNETFYSKEKTVYPESYLLSQLNNKDKIYNINSKKRWYV